MDFPQLPQWPGNADDLVDLLLHEPDYDVRYLILKLMTWKLHQGFWGNVSKPKFEALEASFLLSLYRLERNQSLKFIFVESIGSLNAVKLTTLPGTDTYAKYSLPEASQELYLFDYLKCLDSGSFERAPLVNQLREILMNPETAEAFAENLWHLFHPWYSSCSLLIHANSLREVRNHPALVESFGQGLETMQKVYEYFQRLSLSWKDLSNADSQRLSTLWQKWFRSIGVASFPICGQPKFSNLKKLFLDGLTSFASTSASSEEDAGRMLYAFEKAMLFDLRPKSVMDTPVAPLLCMEPEFSLRDDTPFTEDEKNLMLRQACANVVLASPNQRTIFLPVLLRYFDNQQCIYEAVDRIVDESISCQSHHVQDMILHLLALIQRHITGSLPEQQKYKGKKLQKFDPISADMLDWKDLNLFAFLKDQREMSEWINKQPALAGSVPSLSYLSSLASVGSKKILLDDSSLSDPVRDSIGFAFRLNSLVRLLVFLLTDPDTKVSSKTPMNERAILGVLTPFCSLKSMQTNLFNCLDKLIKLCLREEIGGDDRNIALRKLAMASELVAKLDLQLVLSRLPDILVGFHVRQQSELAYLISALLDLCAPDLLYAAIPENYVSIVKSHLTSPSAVALQLPNVTTFVSYIDSRIN